MAHSSLFLWSVAFLGAIALAFAAGATIFRRYTEIEQKVIQELSDYAAEIYDLLDKMYRRQSMNRIYVMILVPTILFGLLGFAIGISSGPLAGIIAAFVLGAAGFKIPGAFVRGAFQRRLTKFDKQLVDALDIMANAVKSGLSFMQVVQVIEREMPKPIADEFGMVLKENRVGINLADALLNMANRVPSDDLFMIINSVVTLSQQGGDLSEAFDTIAKTIRERQRVTEKIRTLAQAGITQGFILSCIPIVMLGMQWVIQPDYVRLLISTPIGLAMLGGMATLIVLGGLWMKSILTIDV